MKNFLRSAFGLLPLFLLTGCFDTQEEFTVNPDGSGKVSVNSICAPFEMNMGGDDEKKTPEQKLLSSVKSLLENVKGVAAWKDVSYELQDDGRLKFKGTAYFADLNKLDMNMLAIMDFAWMRTNGVFVIRSQMKDSDKTPDSQMPVSEAEMPAKIKEARASFQSSKPMLFGMLGAAKQETVFHMPGKVTKVDNFKLVDGTLKISFSGTNMITAMETLMLDDAWLRRQLAAGRSPMQDGPTDEEFNEKLFGEKLPVQAFVADGVALFDYATEVAAAKKEYALLKKQLEASANSKTEADGKPAAPPAQGGEFKSLKVAGVQRVYVVEGKEDFSFRAFHQSPGYTFALVGELPGAVLTASGGKLVVATAGDGSDLLPEKEWDRKINFPKLDKERVRVLFEVKLNEPNSTVKSFKEISGVLEYSTASGTTNVDLGFTELKAGAVGTAFGAQIKKVSTSTRNQGGTDFEVEFSLTGDRVIESRLVQTDGTETVLGRNGSWSSSDKSSITFNHKGELPASARLVLKLHADVKNYEIPFKLTNIDLMGQALQ